MIPGELDTAVLTANFALGPTLLGTVICVALELETHITAFLSKLPGLEQEQPPALHWGTPHRAGLTAKAQPGSLCKIHQPQCPQVPTALRSIPSTAVLSSMHGQYCAQEEIGGCEPLSALLSPPSCLPSRLAPRARSTRSQR